MDKTQSLTPEAFHVICEKGTEMPNTGIYNLLDKKGSYLCRRCGRALFRSTDKFISSCGWPSFDAEIEKAIKRVPDQDGRRTEILCSHCEAHLGHVFLGENLTDKNLRHCVNSLSIDFVEDQQVLRTEEGIFAGGCFWGVQSLFDECRGVLKTEVGYIGGHVEHPTYEAVCGGGTGHLEGVRVIFNPDKLSYESLLQYFFELHNPTEKNRQGPDVGEQYASAIFYFNTSQKVIAEKLIKILQEKKFSVQTKLQPVSVFWKAEEFHQHYYKKTGKAPYCHFRVKRF